MTESCSQAAFYKHPMFADNESSMRKVAVLTAVMMLAEITGGLWLGSMALLADGFHMATHVGALGISVFAYAFARRHMYDPRYSFGTGKVGDLAGFTSALILIAIALYVLLESTQRLLGPTPIAYGEAIALAVLGLGVNVWSAWIMRGDDHHGHPHHNHNHHHHDTNFRSAYLHIMADAVTSLLAIFALSLGWLWGWRWLDPAVGIIGAFVILSWAWSLVRSSSAVLLDQAPHADMAEQVRNILKNEGADIIDLHIWRVGPVSHVAILSVTATKPLTPQQVRDLLKPLGLAHMTVEINAG